MALPVFQRGYVWNRQQVRGLMDSLYRGLPVGSFLVWATESIGAQHRGEAELAPGIVKLLLDGQQRVTSLYGIVRGEAPNYFDGDSTSFLGLHFHLINEEFSFYSPIKMKGDPLWIDVSQVMKDGHAAIGKIMEKLQSSDSAESDLTPYYGRISSLLAIKEREFHIEEVSGEEMTVDVVVDIFNRVNSGGTKLSKGDLALAKICSDDSEARERLKTAVSRWENAGYHFTLDWLLRNVNTVLMGEAKFLHLHSISPTEFQDGLKRAEKAIDGVLNHIGNRLGLDHDRVLFGRFGITVLSHYIDRRPSALKDEVERDRLLYWYLHCAMWGRFSGSTETRIDSDLARLENLEEGLPKLLLELWYWRGDLRVQPAHFEGSTLGDRFYPILYLLTRTRGARDLGFGTELKKDLLGKMSQLEVHHIFPSSQLKKHGYVKVKQRNQIANFCLLTKETNLEISNKHPVDYLPVYEEKHPGVLASQWIPQDPDLWQYDRYPDFLVARRELLAAAINELLDELLHGYDIAATKTVSKQGEVAQSQPIEITDYAVPGRIGSDEEQEKIEELNEWVVDQGLPAGEISFELADPTSGEPLAVLDLAWPRGLQEGLSEPVAVILDEDNEIEDIANNHGFRCYRYVGWFKKYVEEKILSLGTKGSDVTTHSSTQKLQSEFWDDFGDHAEKSGDFKRPKPQATSWLGWGIGGKECTLISGILVQKNRLWVEVHCNREDGKAHFYLLKQEQNQIESELGYSLDWQERPGKITSSVVYAIDADLSDREKWPSYAGWLLKHMADFKRVFRPRVKQLDASNWVPEEMDTSQQ